MGMGRLYVLTGFAWLIAGAIFGIYIGITDQLNYGNSHAHANLVGFVLSVLFGLLHRNWPSLGKSALAMIQYVAYQAGALLLVAGKIVVDGGGGSAVVATGSIVVLIGMLLMAWMFLTASE